MEKNDLISRAAAIKGLLSMCPEKTEPGSFDEYGATVLCGAVDVVIKGLPAVDAVPVEWLEAHKMEYIEDWGVVPVAVGQALTIWQKEQEGKNETDKEED